MAESTIGWTDYTYNLWRGCTEYGPGCKYCFAAARDRLYEGGLHWGKGAPRILAAHPTRIAPYRWNAIARATGKRKVFASSLADVFDEEVDPAWRLMLWKVIRETPELCWQVVTKRIGLAEAMLPDNFPRFYEHVGIMATVVTQREADRDVPILLDLKARRGVTWAGLSVEPQLEMIVLRDQWLPCRCCRGRGYYLPTFSANHMVPCEPCLEGARKAGIQVLPGQMAVPAGRLDWIIGGGESLQSSHDRDNPPRSYDLAWPRALRDQCAPVGVAFFEKQLGARPVDSRSFTWGPPREPAELAQPISLTLNDRRAGADPDEWPADLRVQQFPEALR